MVLFAAGQDCHSRVAKNHAARANHLSPRDLATEPFAGLALVHVLLIGLMLSVTHLITIFLP